MYEGSLAAISNRADWIMDIEVTNSSDDSLVDLTGDTISIWVTPLDRPWESLLSGSSTDGTITLPTLGTMRVTFTSDKLKDLHEGTHRCFIRANIGGILTQLLAATLPVVDGGPV